ncbi:MAG: type 4a pilus biogenesis protein PilO [Candidatus Paceibacterota bacterium]|jgi:Tfp pilus assembly protein PilO
MNLILPIFLILSSIGIFFGYVDPNYKGSATPSVVNTYATSTSDYSSYGILSLKEELIKYEDISNSSQKIITDRDNLVKKSNQITTVDKNRLNKFLPSSIDNIRLIIELSDMASARGLFAKNISVSSDVKKSTDSVNTDYSSYGTLVVRFSVNSTYENFLLFLDDLENNLRILDITDISFSSTETGFYDFNVGLKTYWLK